MYLISTVETYRVQTVSEVEQMHEAFAQDNHYELLEFGYKTKYIKEKGQIVDEYQVVRAKKVFNDEKEPDRQIVANYTSAREF